MPISKPHSSLGSGNKGSCALLVNYLDKENHELEKKASQATSRNEEIEIRSRQQHFFGHSSDDVSQLKVRQDIDSNISKLGKNDSKYFAPTISFSENELKHLTKLASNGRDINHISQLKDAEFKKYNHLLRDYTRSVMDNYANNFNRQEKGLESGKDLLYYAKIEHQRNYKGDDPEVKHGEAKSGEQKPGLHSHVHVIVSRKDQSQRLKLSPMSNEKSKNRSIGRNSYHVGLIERNGFLKMKRVLIKCSIISEKRLKNLRFKTL